MDGAWDTFGEKNHTLALSQYIKRRNLAKKKIAGSEKFWEGKSESVLFSRVQCGKVTV